MKLRLSKDNAIYFWAACKNEMEIKKLKSFEIDITNADDLNLLYFNGLIQNEFDVDYDFSDFTKSGYAFEAVWTVNHLIEAIRNDKMIEVNELRETYPHLFDKKIER